MLTLTSPLPQKVILIITAALAVLVSVTFFYTLWQWHADWKLINEAVAAPAVTTTDETATMIAAIPDAHLFGQALTKDGDVPISSLQLRVTGIVKLNKESGVSVSKAYISSAGGASKIYQVGDTLPYGVKVYAITPDAVMLENDGHLEKLPLPREPLVFKPREDDDDDADSN